MITPAGFFEKTPKTAIIIMIYIAAFALLFPFNPTMPSAGLDPSWVLGMNQAMAQGMIFGRDIIFTFGPYSFLYTNGYHPATANLMFLSSFYLSLCYALALILAFSKNNNYYLPAFITFILVLFTPSKDIILFSYPIILSIIIYRITLPKNHDDHLNTSAKTTLLLIILFFALGLLPLIKGSITLISSCIIIFCAFMLIVEHKKNLAVSVIISPILGVVTFWLIAKQPLFDIENYFISMSPIISGYTEAMAISGKINHITLYIITSASISYAIIFTPKTPVNSKIFLFFCVAVFLFIAFKGGFVRHDGHAVIAANALVIASIFIVNLIHPKLAVYTLALSLSSFLIICHSYIEHQPKIMVDNLKNTYSTIYNGSKKIILQPNILNKTFKEHLTTINKDLAIETLTGTTDIYSYNQAYLIASNNTWNPRPILQSYSVYTPKLAEKNRLHLIGKNAPDNILFKVEAIDGRFVALEDGRSWPVLLTQYMPTKMEQSYIYLKKVAKNNSAPEMNEIYQGNHQLDEIVALPLSTKTIYAEIDLKPTLIGRLMSIFFKSDKINITVEFDNGKSVSTYLIPAMAKSGFIISPYIESTSDFLFLFDDRHPLQNKTIKSIKISPRHPKLPLWMTIYSMKLSTFEPRVISGGVTSLYNTKSTKINKPITIVPYKISNNNADCVGSLDSLNEASPVPIINIAAKTLSIRGWLVMSDKEGITPDAVFVNLTDSQGSTTYTATTSTPRDDVKSYLNHPQMRDVGYEALIDISELNGHYDLQIARLYKGVFEACQQFKTPIHIIK